MQFANSPFAFAENVKTERNAVSFWTAIGAHVVLLLAIFALAAGRVTTIAKGTLLSPTIEPPHLTLPVLAHSNLGSGSAGASDTAAAGLGHPPQVDNVHLAPPMIQTAVQPQLAVEPTVDIKMASNNMTNLGVTNASMPSVHVGVGTGSTVGNGDGHSVGVGSEAGPGTGTGVLHWGAGGVHNPVLIYQVEPEFSKEAREHKFSGNVQVYLWVDELGNPSPIKAMLATPPEIDGRVTSVMYLFVPDCDPVYAKSKSANAEFVQELKTMDYGGRAFTVRDPEGYLWSVGEYDPWKTE